MIGFQLIMSKEIHLKAHEFFKRHYYIDSKYLINNMHITVYYARRPMFSLEEKEMKCMHVLDTNETRFMVLAPGGENPRPDLFTAVRKVGIRIQKRSDLRKIIEEYRNQVIKHENKYVLGKRKPSNRKRNAFGSRFFQPHISILKAGSGIIQDLSIVGDDFRNYLHELVFDKYIIKRIKKE